MSDPLRSAATISDVEWVRAIAALREPNRMGGYHWVMVWDLAALLNIHPNRVRSKARRAAKRGLSDGCTCGCRGDFELLPAGEALLSTTSSGDPSPSGPASQLERGINAPNRTTRTAGASDTPKL